mmetsp:Transcript_19385/g.56706  ORF Transcript_19385/g.56706 Transcript_19385/m.56706 type:complete len:465 (-) Transcript_19385:281-1675(-)
MNSLDSGTEPLGSLTNIEELERRLSSPSDIASERLYALGHEGHGLAQPLVLMLREAAEMWMSSMNSPSSVSKHARNAVSTVSSEEKKDDGDVNLALPEELNKQAVTKMHETQYLHRALSLHLAVGRYDSTLAEEMGKEGSHSLLSRLARFDLNAINHNWSEEDEDAIVELQDLACEIGSLSSGAFPMKYSPYTKEEMLKRLPLHFMMKPVATAGCANELEECKEQSVLINQVSIRQSAQEDVGFVMWPSAVVLSFWIISNPSLVHGRSIIELGAGCGLVGLVTAGVVKNTNCLMGCDSASSPPKSGAKVIMTDFNEVVLKNIKRNIHLNTVGDFARAEKLDFYEQSGSNGAGGWLDGLGERREAVDLVLAADVICKPEDAVAASNTIFDCLKPGGEAYVVSADAAHRFGVERFESECIRLGMIVCTTDVNELYNGQLLLEQSLGQTSGFIEGMMLTMFHITKLR